MAFYWSFSGNKSPRVSRTLLGILANLNNVSTRPLISKCPCPCTNPLVTVPRAPTRIGIIVTFMFHSLFFFFNYLARSRYLSFFFTFFEFYFVIRRDSKVHNSASSHFSFFFYFLFFFFLFFFFFFFLFCYCWV